MIIAHHLVMSAYGTWLPNDLRGSGSIAVRKDHLRPLGPIHFGRKSPPEQPSRQELRNFYREANPLLDFEILWFKEPERRTIAGAFASAIRDRGYTVWACAICSNHAHLLVRVHRDDAITIWHAFADPARDALQTLHALAPPHPVWSDRPYKIFLNTPAEVHARIGYIRKNPLKERLPEQHWDFITPYDGRPLRTKKPPTRQTP